MGANSEVRICVCIVDRLFDMQWIVHENMYNVGRIHDIMHLRGKSISIDVVRSNP